MALPGESFVVRNSALYGAPFWCYPSGKSCFGTKKKKVRFGSHLLKWCSFEKKRELFPTFLWGGGTALLSEIELFSPKHDYYKKKRLSSTKESRLSKLLSRRAILALFFSQCTKNTMLHPLIV